MRQIQDMRKEAKYQVDEQVMVDWHSEDQEIISAIAEWFEEIKKDTVLKSLEQKEKHGDYDLYKESLLAPDKKTVEELRDQQLINRIYAVRSASIAGSAIKIIRIEKEVSNLLKELDNLI